MVLLSCLALATNAWAQVRIGDAPVDLAGPQPDSLLVSGDPSACLVPSTLTLAGISQNARSSMEIGSIQTGACRWVIRGLAAGSYEIAIAHARGSGGRIRFDYVPGQLTALTIPAPAATVTGTVRINGEPVPGATIMFMTKPMQSGLIRVVTNGNGVFEVSLPEAGDVGMRLSGSTVYGQGVRPTFNAGANRFDWEITGGTLVIRDEHTPRAMSFMINVWHDDGVQGWSAPNFGSLRVMRGAPFGTHRVVINRGSAPEETITTVDLSPDAPRAEVVIDVP